MAETCYQSQLARLLGEKANYQKVNKAWIFGGKTELFGLGRGRPRWGHRDTFISRGRPWWGRYWLTKPESFDWVGRTCQLATSWLILSESKPKHRRRNPELNWTRQIYEAVLDEAILDEAILDEGAIVWRTKPKEIKSPTCHLLKSLISNKNREIDYRSARGQEDEDA